MCTRSKVNLVEGNLIAVVHLALAELRLALLIPAKVRKVSFTSFRRTTSRNMDNNATIHIELSEPTILISSRCFLLDPFCAIKISMRPRASPKKKNSDVNKEASRPIKKKSASVPVIVISDDEDEVVLVSCKFRGKDPQNTGKDRSK